MASTLLRIEGKFGPITVVDDAGQRSLNINGERQGALLLSPSANEYSEDLPEDAPGPVSSSLYTDGWYLPGIADPYGSGVMVGLGSGAGAMSLLANFPEVDLTVIEIDPAIVDVANEYFPMLEYYQDRGRLEIIEADACEYLKTTPDTWGFGCGDAYTGTNRLVHDYIELLCQRCNRVYLNVIDRFNGPGFAQMLALMQRNGKYPQELFKVIPPAVQLPYTCRSNWIFASHVPDIQDLQDFTPFPYLEGPDVAWEHFLSNALSLQL